MSETPHKKIVILFGRRSHATKARAGDPNAVCPRHFPLYLATQKNYSRGGNTVNTLRTVTVCFHSVSVATEGLHLTKGIGLGPCPRGGPPALRLAGAALA